METVTLRLDDDVVRELDNLARARGMNRSELLHGQINELIGRKTPITPREHKDSLNEYQLNEYQRHTMAMLHHLTALVMDSTDVEGGVDSSVHWAKGNALVNGFVDEYGYVFDQLHSEVSAEDTGFVDALLETFDLLHGAVARLRPSVDDLGGHEAAERLIVSGQPAPVVLPMGSGLYRFARYRISQQEGYIDRVYSVEEDQSGGDGLDQLATYRRMVAVFTRIQQGYDRQSGGAGASTTMLTSSDIRAVLTS